ncbi:MAG: hypothetical protein C0404_03610, partial [Verrucomicrobia bacterium]|nr:hypothetical protein [Verrucomicrobiota bacterium]
IVWPPPPTVKGTSKKPDGTWMAILDGIGIVEAGDTIRQRKDNLVFLLKVKSISDKGVVLDRLEIRRSK